MYSSYGRKAKKLHQEVDKQLLSFINKSPPPTYDEWHADLSIKHIIQDSARSTNLEETT